jgi:hypothetical protein
LDTGALPSSNRSTPGGWSIWRPDLCPPDGVHSTQGPLLHPFDIKGPRGARLTPLITPEALEGIQRSVRRFSACSTSWRMASGRLGMGRCWARHESTASVKSDGMRTPIVGLVPVGGRRFDLDGNAVR